MVHPESAIDGQVLGDQIPPRFESQRPKALLTETVAPALPTKDVARDSPAAPFPESATQHCATTALAVLALPL